MIRVGHAVRTLRANPDAPPAPETLDELAHGLAFWAARYRELSGAVAPDGQLSAAEALSGVARLDDQSGLIAHRLDRLERSHDWTSSLRAMRPATSPDEVPARLESLIDTAVAAYPGHAHSSPVLLVHTATAPNAVCHVLPVLPTEQWVPSFTAAWAASAALVATYSPAKPAPRTDVVRGHDGTVADSLQRAAEHGDEHVLKFADTAVEAYDRTGVPDLLAASGHARELIPTP